MRASTLWGSLHSVAMVVSNTWSHRDRVVTTLYLFITLAACRWHGLASEYLSWTHLTPHIQQHTVKAPKWR